jgi:hypothetical protein
MRRFRIVYKDSRQQHIEADDYRIEAQFVRFTADGHDILNIAADKVESVADGDVPEAE